MSNQPERRESNNVHTLHLTNSQAVGVKALQELREYGYIFRTAWRTLRCGPITDDRTARLRSLTFSFDGGQVVDMWCNKSHTGSSWEIQHAWVKKDAKDGWICVLRRRHSSGETWERVYELDNSLRPSQESP